MWRYLDKVLRRNRLPDTPAFMVFMVCIYKVGLLIKPRPPNRRSLLEKHELAMGGGSSKII